MRITSIDIQARNKDRVNISVDGRYRFSLDIYQIGELGLKLNCEYSEEDLLRFETESQFGKTYSRALEYCLMRPHSSREVRNYLYKKTKPTRTKTGEVRPGISSEIADRVFDRLLQKGYIQDESFARYWVENRKQKSGVSVRRLTQELRAKGVDQAIIMDTIESSDRSDLLELQKVIEKKRHRYDDEKKFKTYLMRQGFAYDDILEALHQED